MPPTISNLTSIFRSGINMRNYGAIVSNVRNKVIGAVPKDLLGVATRRLPKGGYKQTLSEINQAYEETACILKKVEKLQSDAFERIPATYENFGKISDRTERLGELSYDEVFKYHDKIFDEAETECLLEAESHLLQKLTPIMQDLKNVILTPCGEGNFKRVYKLEFKFANPNKAVAPQALGVYRENVMSINTGNLHLRFLDNLSDEEYAKVMNWSVDYTKKNRARVRHSILEDIKEVKSLDYAKYGHGAIAEANISEYIKYMAGHKLKPEDGIVLPELFSLNGSTPYFVSEFVGKDRKARKVFDYSAFGLRYTDFNLNKSDGNINRDLGEILPLTNSKPSAIVGNPTGTRISKKFSRLNTLDQQLKYLSDLRDKAINEKNLLNKYATLNAINEIVQTRLTVLG